MLRLWNDAGITETQDRRERWHKNQRMWYYSSLQWGNSKVFNKKEYREKDDVHTIHTVNERSGADTCFFYSVIQR